MSSYKGTFSVLNDTSGPIKGVKVTHSAGNQMTGTVFEKQIGQNESAGDGQVNAESSSKDYWKISFNNSAGDVITGDCTCAFKEEDAGHSVQVKLSDSSYAIIMPVSNSCDNKSYN